MPTAPISGQVVAELDALRRLAKMRRTQSFTLFRKRLDGRLVTRWSPLEEAPESPDAFPRPIAAE